MKTMRAPSYLERLRAERAELRVRVDELDGDERAQALLELRGTESRIASLIHEHGKRLQLSTEEIAEQVEMEVGHAAAGSAP